MNRPRSRAEDYINFLIATPTSYSCLEAGRVQPEQERRPAHDAFSRLLQRLEPDAAELWAEAETQVQKGRGCLILDDSTLDKPYARKMALVTRHWSGKHRQVVQGINLLSLLWTDGERYIPCDYRLYDKEHDGKSKNDHFCEMVQTAYERGFAPEYVLFDSWYGSLENLKLITSYGWRWFTQLKGNRTVNPDGKGQCALAAAPLTDTGTVVHLKGYGFIRVFKIVAPDGDIEFWATNDLEMNDLARLRLSETAAMIETYHRGIKQFCGVERSQARLDRTQRNHIGLALRAFLRIECHAFYIGLSWFELKHGIIRKAVTSYLVAPIYTLIAATA